MASLEEVEKQERKKIDVIVHGLGKLAGVYLYVDSKNKTVKVVPADHSGITQEVRPENIVIL